MEWTESDSLSIPETLLRGLGKDCEDLEDAPLVPRRGRLRSQLGRQARL
jgi:hypothetical protein